MKILRKFAKLIIKKLECLLIYPKYRIRKNKEILINKIADKADLNKISFSLIIEELLRLKNELDTKDLPYLRYNWKQADGFHIPWLRKWEYAQSIIFSGASKDSVVLDAGGSSSMLSIYLAKKGCNVYTIDIDTGKYHDANEISQRLNLNMKNRLGNIINMDFQDNFFDVVFCISVIEHLIEIDQSVAMRELARVLKPGGILCLTFDYGFRASDNPILSPEDVLKRLVAPSGLVILGNKNFILETKESDKSLSYTFGSLFLTK